MKPLFLVLIFALTIATTACRAQLMRTLNDAPKLKAKEQAFIGKPLKSLLKEIGPEIEQVFAQPSTNGETPAFLSFRFVGQNQMDTVASDKKLTPLGIRVYLKENFDWDFQKRPKGRQTIWTKEDAKKYGGLTIVGLRVYGNGIVEPRYVD